MISIHIDAMEYYDENKNRFIYEEAKVFTFEHSLKAIAEWESQYKVPLLSQVNLTGEQLLYYIECMSLDDDFDLYYITDNDVKVLVEYMKDIPTATTINKNMNRKKSKNVRQAPRVLTSELIYAYMANGQVPFECENWNIHRLLTLLDVIGELNSPPEKMSSQEIINQNKELNKQRRARSGSSG